MTLPPAKRRVICTPAPSTKARALGFSTETVMRLTAHREQDTVAISLARASRVWYVDASTVWSERNQLGGSMRGVSCVGRGLT